MSRPKIHQESRQQLFCLLMKWGQQQRPLVERIFNDTIDLTERWYGVKLRPAQSCCLYHSRIDLTRYYWDQDLTQFESGDCIHLDDDDVDVNGHDDDHGSPRGMRRIQSRDWRKGELVKNRKRKKDDEGGEPEGTIRALVQLASVVEDVASKVSN
jgi:hypothetical protein